MEGEYLQLISKDQQMYQLKLALSQLKDNCVKLGGSTNNILNSFGKHAPP